MENITGNEPVYGSACATEQSHHIEVGITLRQHAQLEFMKALVIRNDGLTIKDIRETAGKLTNAYIQSLNE